jgi:glycosyltransferase involved in cell wall biosynthesis
MSKVLLITNIPNPYRIPLFNEICKQFHASGIHLKIIFGAAGYKRRFFTIDPSEISYDYEILKDEAHTFSEDAEKSYFLYKGLKEVMNKEKPDAVIVAGFSPATMKVFFRKLLKGTPYIIYSGTIEQGNRSGSLLRRIQRTILCKGASAYVAYGNLAKKYLISIGAPESKVFIGRNTVDTTFFSERTDAFRKENKTNNSKVRFTYLGYLVPRKNVQLLLESVKIVAEQRRDFVLDVLGDGISSDSLKKYVSDNKLEDVVIFHGFKQKAEIPEFFAQSSGLLFQTDFDIWGLVLNEAMAAGVPCLSSPNAGATYDLIQEGETGFRVDFTDRELVASKIKWLIENKEEAKLMGERARAFMSKNVTLELAAKGFLNAVLSVLKK